MQGSTGQAHRVSLGRWRIGFLGPAGVKSKPSQ